MDILKKAIIGKYALVTMIDSTDLVSKAVSLHGPMSDTAIMALGRLLTVTAFMTGEFKSDERLSITYDVDGGLGKIVCAGTRLKVRGYVENKNYTLYDKEGHPDVAHAVGNGTITVIKDLCLKEPYIGKCAVARGDMSDDFSYYFTASEQVPSAVSVGVDVLDGVVKRSGGIFIQLLPDCSEDIKVMLVDIASDFANVPEMLEQNSIEDIIKDRFMAFDIEFCPTLHPMYKCTCSDERMRGIIKSVGRDEATNIIKEQGNIEIKCDFCSKKYVYNQSDVENIFSNN